MGRARWAGGPGRRSVAQAGLGRVRPTLAYKCRWGGGVSGGGPLVPSSKTHHGCGGYLADLKLGNRRGCARCGEPVDRYVNAACNILVAAELAETQPSVEAVSAEDNPGQCQ